MTFSRKRASPLSWTGDSRAGYGDRLEEELAPVGGEVAKPPLLAEAGGGVRVDDHEGRRTRSVLPVCERLDVRCPHEAAPRRSPDSEVDLFPGPSRCALAHASPAWGSRSSSTHHTRTAAIIRPPFSTHILPLRGDLSACAQICAQTFDGPCGQHRKLLCYIEAPVGIEPTIADLQSAALPLGHGAVLESYPPAPTRSTRHRWHSPGAGLDDMLPP
jgi:hypothetical protein